LSRARNGRYELFARRGFTGGGWRGAYKTESIGAVTVILGYIAPKTEP